MALAGTLTYKTELDQSGLRDGLNKSGGIAKSIASGIAKGAMVAGTALTGMVAVGVKEFAKLEQSIGGVETLFQDSAKTVIANSKEAYRTAGLDANSYMEQVTSFSASLLQSLGGDTEKAAEYADRAIVDMSDNANKMGTSIDMIQNAYQGFAKQNYTMLDNLKLGYGGTKTEMERLIADASKMTEEQDKLNVSVNEGDMSFGNIVNAISVMQSHMKIAGTTSKEASSTIQGSFSSMKAAFTNFLSGAGDISQVIETVTIFGKNVSKALIKIAPDIINGLVQLINSLIPQLPGLINKLLPALLSGVVELIKGVVGALPELLRVIAEMLPTIIETLIQGLTDAISEIASQMPKIIPMLVNAILDGILSLLDNIDLVINAGMDLVMGLLQGIITAIPLLVAKLPLIIQGIINAILGALPEILALAPEIIITLITGLIESIPMLIEMAPQIIGGIITGLVKGFKNIFETGKSILSRLWNGISSAIPNLLRSIPQIPAKILQGIRNGIGGVVNIGFDIVRGIGNGITSGLSWIKNVITGFVGSVTKFIKRLFKIGSPSKLMADEVGQWLPKGIAVGIDANVDSVEDAMDNMYQEMDKAIQMENAKLSFNTVSGDVYNKSFYQAPISIDLDANVEMNGTKVGRLVAPSVVKTIKTGGIQ